MGRLSERLGVARQALQTLRELPLTGDVTDIQRDAAIQRFEYTVEAVWKASQQFLRDAEGLEVGSPKGAFRGLLQVSILGEEDTELALAMVDDRNDVVHTYAKAVALRIFGRLDAYAGLMDRMLSELEGRA
jgi:nucleotidyltransferase substrate binding protein (TIGR01987 family)